ncbi:DUF4194 domain-containing protein [Arthrobacter sp. Marseille-P9274]|uniref:DUF4194 domain-containing protein n=1 Tax=Arthrobacter sp. Marseille-P9274 TaxID=2866572 RepID=UPI0021C6EA9C|nr:DUF4194 domain-containing protein [Arthrobacter sp. Marseille-P9274]
MTEPVTASDGVLTKPNSDVAVWDGDPGALREPSRRALVQLLRGPYLSAANHSHLWTALLADEDSIRSRLADMFLELVTDEAAQVAFVRNISAEAETPKVLRTATLTFLDTALLLHLRQQLLHDASGGKTIVGADEIADQLQVYRGKDNADPAGFSKRVNSSWQKMVKYGLLATTSTEGRYEVSPVLRLVFGPEEIAAVQQEYRRLAAEARKDSDDGEASERVDAGDEEGE